MAFPASPNAKSGAMTFNYTGAQQNFTVPKRVTHLMVTASGARGAGGGGGGLVTGHDFGYAGRVAGCLCWR